MARWIIFSLRSDDIRCHNLAAGRANTASDETLLDPADDAPEWTDELFEIAAFKIGEKVIRPATGYLGPNGIVRGRPPSRGRTKQQVTLRLDPDVIEKFLAVGPGWQGRINDALRKAVGL